MDGAQPSSTRRQRGAAVVSIIPVRGGNGEMERLAALGHFTPPTLVQLEDALDGCAPVRGHRRDGRPVGRRERWPPVSSAGPRESSACAAERERSRRAPDRVRCVRRDGDRVDDAIDCEVAIVGSGFAGSLLARVLAVLGYDVVLLERGTHPRFAIGESSTPLANLSLERLAMRYGLRGLLSAGRRMDGGSRTIPKLRRGLKRGFTFYRHHPGESFADRRVRLGAAARRGESARRDRRTRTGCAPTSITTSFARRSLPASTIAIASS